MTDPDPPSPGRMMGGMALMVVGLLILIPSGLCTAGFGVVGMTDMFKDPAATLAFLTEVLIVGGPFILVGFGLFRAGLWLRRKPTPKIATD